MYEESSFSFWKSNQKTKIKFALKNTQRSCGVPNMPTKAYNSLSSKVITVKEL